MGRKVKDGTGLSAYLNSIGVLANGTDEEIRRCKKLYWAKYRKDWKKNKRQQNKTYVILFSFKEARIISQKAGKLSITPGKFIKTAALSNQTLIGPVLTGQIREQLVLFILNLESIMDEKRIPGPVKDEVLGVAYSMEKVVLEILK